MKELLKLFVALIYYLSMAASILFIISHLFIHGGDAYVAKLFTLGGLVLDAVGAALISYDFLTYSESPHFTTVKLRNLKASFPEIIEKQERRLGATKSEYSRATLMRDIEKNKKWYEESVRGLEEEIARLPGKTKAEAVRWALLGFKLLIAGFSYQAIGALLS